MLIFSYVMTGVAGIMVGVLGMLIADACIKASIKRQEKKEKKQKLEEAKEEIILKAFSDLNKD